MSSLHSLCRRRPVLPTLRSDQPCDIRAEFKRRNGLPSFWCFTHGQEAWAPDGTAIPACPGAALPAVPDTDIFDLFLEDWPGGAAAWGAAAPAITFGHVEPEDGIHVHARKHVGGGKLIDASFAIVRVHVGPEVVELDSEAGLAHLASVAAGADTVPLRCPRCKWLHLDRDHFAVHAHRKHVCNRCGHSFWARDLTVSNPAAAVRQLPGVGPARPPRRAPGRLVLDRERFSAFAIWGSNPAILWTCPQPEWSGIHVHTWDLDGQPGHDETYGEVELEGHLLDVDQVRALMIQRAQPHLAGRVAVVRCSNCDTPHFDTGLASLVPTNVKECPECGHSYRTERRRKVVSNPLLLLIEELGL